MTAGIHRITDRLMSGKQLRAHNINLYRAYTAEKRAAHMPKGASFAAAAGIAAAAAAGVIIVLAVMINTASRDIERAREYIGDPKNEALYAEIRELKEQSSEIEAVADELERAGEYIDTYPELTARALEVIAACADETTDLAVSGYDSGTGELSFTAAARDVESIPRVMSRLTDTGLFSDVNFTGYSRRKDGAYTINVKCTLAYDSMPE